MENVRNKSERSLLDLLLVVVENIRLLVLGPLLAGVFVLGIGFLVPQSFTSNAILSLPMPTSNSTLNPTPNPTVPTTTTPTQAAALMLSAVVLDPVILADDADPETSLEEKRFDLVRRVRATVGKDMLLRLEVTANSPVKAQSLANSIIDEWLKTTVPGKKDRADLETRLAYAKASLDSVTRLLEKITAEGVANLGKPLTRGEAGTSLVAVGELQALYLSEVLAIPRALQGLSRDVIVQQPTLPMKAVAPKKAFNAVLAAMLAGSMLLIFVFARHAVRQSVANSVTNNKWAQLRSSFRRALGRPAD